MCVDISIRRRHPKVEGDGGGEPHSTKIVIQKGLGNFVGCAPCRRPLDFNYFVGSNVGREGLKRRGAPVEQHLAKFRLKRSHADPLRDKNGGLVGPVTTWQ